jgi:hypothetical protein
MRTQIRIATNPFEASRLANQGWGTLPIFASPWGMLAPVLRVGGEVDVPLAELLVDSHGILKDAPGIQLPAMSITPRNSLALAILFGVVDTEISDEIDQVESDNDSPFVKNWRRQLGAADLNAPSAESWWSAIDAWSEVLPPADGPEPEATLPWLSLHSCSLGCIGVTDTASDQLFDQVRAEFAAATGGRKTALVAVCDATGTFRIRFEGGSLPQSDPDSVERVKVALEEQGFVKQPNDEWTKTVANGEELVELARTVEEITHSGRKHALIRSLVALEMNGPAGARHGQ